MFLFYEQVISPLNNENLSNLGTSRVKENMSMKLRSYLFRDLFSKLSKVFLFQSNMNLFKCTPFFHFLIG